jgi:uncharacterized membrane protein YhaH (DUF805 family)
LPRIVFSFPQQQTLSKEGFTQPIDIIDSIQHQQRRQPMFSLWSFYGRIGRRVFWIESVSVFLLSLLLVYLTGPVEYDSRSGAHGPILAFIPAIAISWISVAATVKRWHDLGHSGWMILLNFAVIPIPFTFIYTYFFRGTRGPNRFGTDPIQ